MSPQPLRVAYLVSQYPAVSHTFVLREVFALRQRGIQIDVASINDAPPRDRLTQPEALEMDRTFYVKQAGIVGALKSIVWLLLHHPSAFVRGPLTALRLARWDALRVLMCGLYCVEAAILARWMKKRSLTHLHVHFATPAATVALFLARIAPVTFSITVHGPDEFYDVPGYYLAQKVAAASFVVCISFFAESQLMKITPSKEWSKFDISRLGVDCTHFLPRASVAQSGTFEVLCVGRLVSTKGQRILIQAIGQLIQSESRALKLRLVGDGPDRADLELLVRVLRLEEHIRFEGSVNQDRIQQFYGTSDVFALASFAEGIPVVLMEAMAMEIPCIATCINGIPELIRDGVDGLLVAPADVEGMAAGIARLMDDPALRQTLGKAGRQRVQTAYNAEGSADRLASIFTRRLEAHS
jgi:glycosyltransferase involved in cell wall biosynthesis